MSYKFKEDFNVLENFENNEYQSIMMGVANNNPDNVVVINQFKKSDLINSSLVNEFKNSMTSLISFEETDEEAVVVTKYNEGMPLSNYLKNYDTTLKSRLNFAYEFLKKISIYNFFDHFFMGLLIDEDQIIMKDDELLLNELLVINSTNDIESATFNDVCKKIGSILENIIFSADEAPNENIKEFVNNLKKDSHSYGDLNEIHEAFKKIYLYDLFLDDDSNQDNSKAGPTIIAGAAGLAGAASSMINSSRENNSNGQSTEGESQDDWESDLRSTFGRAPIDDNNSSNILSDDILDNETNSDELETPDNSTPEIAPLVVPLNINKDVNDMSTNSTDDSLNGPDSLDSADITDNNKDEVKNNEPPLEVLDKEHDDEILSVEEEEQLQALFSNNNSEDEVVVKEKKKNGCLWLLLILLLLLLLIFGFNSMKKSFLSPKEKPIVEIVTTRIDDSYFFENKSEFSGESSLKEAEWKITLDGELIEMSNSEDFTITLDEDGDYIVELRVLDSNNVWSETEQSKFTHVAISNENGQDPNNSFVNIEKLDNYTIEYDNNQVTKDESIFRNGSYSFRMDFDSEKSDKIFTIKDTIMDDNATISLWIRCSSTDPVELSFEGYNNQTIVFEKKLKHIPAVTNQWRMLQFNVRVPKLVDSIKVTVGTTQGTVWIDDFAINSYK